MRTYNVAADLKSAADSRSGGSGDPLEQDLLLASRNRGNHIVADEIIWEQYVPDNRPYRPLRGRCRKTYCSQVFRPALSAFPPTTFGIVTNLKYRNHRDASEYNAERRLSLRVETVAGDETITDCGT